MLLLQRLSGRSASFLIGLTLWAALGSSARELYAKTPNELANERWERSQALLADLNAVPEPELGLEQYKLVAEAFKSVHRADPASGYCDDALLGAANIYARMASRFDSDSYKKQAIDAYKYVISQYPYSNRLKEASEAIRKLEAGEPVFLAPPASAEDVEDNPAGGDPADISRISKAAEAETPASEAPSAGMTAVRYEPSPGSSHTVAVAQKVEPSPNRMRESLALIQDVRYWRHADNLRIVVQLDDFVPFRYDALASPPRLYFDLFSAKLTGDLKKGVSIAVPDDPVVSAIRLGQNRESKARMVLDLSENAVFNVSWLSSPPRMVLEIRSANGTPAPAKAETEQVAKVEPQTSRRTFEDALADARRLQEAAVRDKPASTGFLPSAQAASLPPSVSARTEKRPAELAVASADPEPTILAKVTPPAEIAPRPREPEPEKLAAPKPADSPSSGPQGLIRALGLKIGRVVIDAGHGGHDTGMIGQNGLREKDVVLDIALELGRLVEQNLGAEVVYTRTDDTYVKPAVRTKVANNAKADLFVSIHANASSVRSVRGIETYYLNLTTDAWAMSVASRENAASDHSVHELRDLLGKIAQQDRIAESREFAKQMQAAIFSGLTKGTNGLRNRGVRQAPLIVLIGAQMPAILAEVGFLSNPTDEKLFRDKAYRKQVAQHLYDGVAAYMGTLSNNQLTMSDEPRASAARD